jgi:hypothetical protein
MSCRKVMSVKPNSSAWVLFAVVSFGLGCDTHRRCMVESWMKPRF